MEHEHLSFPDAVEDLACRAVVSGQARGPRAANGPRAREPTTSRSSAPPSVLPVASGEPRAIGYLKSRPHPGSARFGVGYAPDDALLDIATAVAGRQVLAGRARDRHAGDGGKTGYDRFRDA